MTKADKLKDLFFPPRCPICDDVTGSGIGSVCEKCRKKLTFIKEPTCLKCGKPITKETEYCRDCTNRRHYFKKGVSVFEYGSISDSLYRFKNKGRAEYARYYARAITERHKDFIRAVHPDALIPVPVHHSKLLKRGYDQSLVLCKEISKLTKIPVCDKLIVRSKKTVPLRDLGIRERQINLNKAFKIGLNDVKLKTIIIIDDIYTTGSTIDEISRTVLERFPCDIYFITLTVGRGI
ncbi:MAG: double zinc ribbon domain-containing protein [Lachnospiraceae bacterium]|nr:double zinc ribbon domain-containing protein [Lachnospiraceae bacterium]